MDSKPKTPSWLVGGTALIASSLLVYFGTGLNPRGWTTWCAAVPVLAFAARARIWPSLLVAFGAWALGGLNLWSYMSDLLGLPLAVRLAVILLPALLFGVTVGLWRRQSTRGRHWRALLILPSFWVTTEFLLASASPHGTFGSLAYTQMEFLPVVQLASATGVSGVSFAVLLAASALGLLVAPALPRQAKLRITAVVVLTFGAVLAWGWLRLHSGKDSEGEITVGLAASSDARRIFPMDSATAQELLGAYADVATNLARAGSELVVLPEKIAWLGEADALGARERFRTVAKRDHVGIVVGWARRDGPKVWNEAVLFQEDGSELTYEKRHLLPGLEWEFAAGDSYATTTSAGRTWGLAVCKDMDFPEIGRAYGSRGVELLLVPAWDFLADGWLHSRMAVMRGVEGGFTIARAAKQGLLTVSDPFGRVVAEAAAPGEQFSMLVVQVRLKSVPTLYRRWGDWFAWLCVGVTLTVLFVQNVPWAKRQVYTS
jgi:apolipoprotein N-acyltransferase